MLFVLKHTDGSQSFSAWRADIGREIVERWHEVDDLTVIEINQLNEVKRTVPAREWYGGTAR